MEPTAKDLEVARWLREKCRGRKERNMLALEVFGSVAILSAVAAIAVPLWDAITGRDTN